MKGGKEKNKMIGKEGATMDTWTQEELGGADFGDKRLTKRFVKLVSDLAAKQEQPIVS
jgi:hypothetical protein